MKKTNTSTPETLTENLLAEARTGSISEVLFIAVQTDGEVVVGWSESTYLKLMGMAEVAKARLLQGMWTE